MLIKINALVGVFLLLHSKYYRFFPACHYLFLEFLRDDRKDLPSNVIAAEDVLLFTTTIRK